MEAGLQGARRAPVDAADDSLESSVRNVLLASLPAVSVRIEPRRVDQQAPPRVDEATGVRAESIRGCGGTRVAKQNGGFDADLVTRRSRMTDVAKCKAVACVAGKVGASCNGLHHEYRSAA